MWQSSIHLCIHSIIMDKNEGKTGLWCLQADAQAPGGL